MIVDCHCHAGLGDGLTGPWDTSARLDRYLPRAARAGIGHTVLFAAFHSDYAVANREVARIVASRPERFSGFAFVHPVRDRGRIAALVQEAVLEHGFRGIKVHRHDARITREICEVARAFSLPILYDVMGEVSVVELLAREYPDVDFVIPHLGSFSDDWRAQQALIDHLVRHRNVYTDTSGVRRFDLLEEALARAGPHKVLFGSDGPWLHPGVELAKVRLLGLGPSAERLVLGQNLLRLVARAGRRRGTARPQVVTAAPPVPQDPWTGAQFPLDGEPFPSPSRGGV
ncbi:MAG: amidohydrolase family protein [Solirubrobacteraceae bacterium]